MSQDYNHQGLDSFSNVFERPQDQQQQQQQHIAHQIQREKLRVEGFEPPPPLVGVEEGGESSGIQVYETVGMLSEMFNFQTTPTAVDSATALLQNQLSHNYRHPNQQPHQQQQQPPPTTDLGSEWFGDRHRVVVGGSLQVPFEDANAKVLSNRDSVTAHYQRQQNHVPNISTAESMQLFLMNPQPRSPPSQSSSQPTTSSLQGFPSPVGGHFGQFICGGASTSNPIGGVNVIEGQGLSLSLSSTLQHLEAAKVEELRMSSGGEMLFFNQGSQNHHVGFGSSLGLVNVLRNSKYAKAAQELLEEFCSVGRGQLFKKINKASRNNNTTSASINPNGSNNNSSSSKDNYIPPNLSAGDRLDHQRRKVKLLSMLDEVDKRYNHYCEQMQMVVNSFDLVMGFGASLPYTALAQKAMSRHFKCLKDGVAAQLKKTCEALGEKDASTSGLTKGETPRLKVLEQSLRQQRAFQQMGMMEQEAAWRPQRGLPERSVNILRAWLFEHFLNPYPSDADKHLLARQTGLSRNQVANWFINARVRLWKPMVEDMYQREAKEDEDDDMQDQNSSNAQTPTPNYISNSNTERKSSATATIYNTTVAASDKKSQINAPENDPSIVAMNSHSFPTMQADSDDILSRRDGVSGGEYGTTNMANNSGIGSTMIRFGTSTTAPGDVSLTLGLRHAGNLPDNTHFFG